MAGLQVMLETGRLKVAAGLREGAALVAELRNMQVKVTPEGREGYGSWREGEHDDLVLATALACWRSQVRSVGEMGMRLL